MGNSCNNQKNEEKEQDIIEAQMQPIIYSTHSIEQNQPVENFFQKETPNLLQSQVSENLRHKGAEKQFSEIKNKKEIKLPDGTIYIGEVENSMPDGHGKQLWNNGDEFVGYFVAGKRNGLGKFYKKDGYTYHGNFTNNKISGYGSMTFPNGDEYKGNFTRGKFDGEGTLTMADGTIKKGNYRKGLFLDG